MTEGRRALPESLARGAGAIPKADAERIRLVVFDVDGVLTDAGVYQGRTESGEAVELKRFNIQDGLGLKLLEMGGIGVVLISGRVSPATEVRAGELKLEMYQDGGAQKVAHLTRVMERDGISWNEVAMLADDIPDLAVLRRVGFRAAVSNAVAEVMDVADFVTRAAGGHGAAREFCEAILQARGLWDDLVEQYVAERGGPA